MKISSEKVEREETTNEVSECPSADEVVIEAGTLQMNLSPSPRINPHPVHPWFTEPHHSVMLLPPCLFHYLL